MKRKAPLRVETKISGYGGLAQYEEFSALDLKPGSVESQPNFLSGNHL